MQKNEMSMKLHLHHHNEKFSVLKKMQPHWKNVLAEMKN